MRNRIGLFLLLLTLWPLRVDAERPNAHRPSPEEIVKKEKDYKLTLISKRFAQGALIVLKLTPLAPGALDWDQLKVIWNQDNYPLYKVEDDYMAFLPVPPEIKPGTYPLEIAGRSERAAPASKEYRINIQKARFLVRNITLKVPEKYTTKKLSKETLQFIKECEAIKSRSFKTDSKLMIDGQFIFPVKEGKINSPFYSRRNYINRKGKPHGGTDFVGQLGDPIYAVQSGRVLIARPMYYEGILTVIDHGAKIFSLYMHQSETLVKEGDYVTKGARIGKVGSTGMSTGPHLHLGMRVHGVMVDPLSILALKF